ncbi:fatty acyl-CoA hydrolase precursor, medium chain-like [Heteronotia binoei]|uniref:fatty acyl-CoA hydrolase precursor, medium chain-like n=1 Tax=Heteronotia binoei TaxID=13085 RepID=UPI00292FEDFA|nr:fatty acyl-CoA hydrolase precursor, medium chain-like [Heteronotia binoei]
MKMLPASKSWLLVGVLLCAKSSAGSAADAQGDKNAHPEVITTYGRLRGMVIGVKGTDQPVNAFLGIPFAKPPTGSLRFTPPQPPEPWSHVRDATSFSPMCLQDPGWFEIFQEFMNVTFPDTTTSEDCLYLNVYTPDTKGQLPVMVWIHGGALEMGGASMYDGSALSAYEDVVVVTIHYRVDILGFFSTGSAEAHGNWGLLDQTAALRWVQENIRSFGGDPQCVTIFGESAGGFSVGAHLLSPLSKGLFHRAISQSGVALLSGLWTPHPEVLAKEIADVSGCGTSSAEMLRCLRNKTEEELVSLMKEVAPMYAVVDGEFFPKAPEELLAAKEFSAIPYLVGVNNHEYGLSIMVIVMKSKDILDGIDRENITAAFQPVASSMGLSPESAKKVLDEYLGDTEDRIKLRERFQELMGDAVFVVPSVQIARSQRDSGAPVYFYEYQHGPSRFKDIRPDSVKANHGDEIFSVFGFPFLNASPFANDGMEDEKQLSKTIMKYWANFARTGNPNGKGLVKWPLYDQNEGYLELNLQQQAAEKLKKKQVDFWLGILNDKMKKATKEKEAHEDL